MPTGTYAVQFFDEEGYANLRKVRLVSLFDGILCMRLNSLKD